MDCSAMAITSLVTSAGLWSELKPTKGGGACLACCEAHPPRTRNVRQINKRNAGEIAAMWGAIRKFVLEILLNSCGLCR